MFDLFSLKYVEAVLFEVQRFGTIVPTSVPHRTTKDVHLEGFVIPKVSTIGILSGERTSRHLALFPRRKGKK